jgi:methionyl-tRNA formyltransferase
MPGKLRIVFMGTPEFAVASLKGLLEAGMNIVGVITAPDKPSGRGMQVLTSPVKDFAIASGIDPVLQPPNLKDPAFLEELRALRADLQIVVAFRMLPEAVWSMPAKGTVNLHASLLPDYRGAAPINWVIINGEKETGVTTFLIEKEIDTGKILFREKVMIEPEMDAGLLHDTLMLKGADLLIRTAEAIESGNYKPVSQNEFRPDYKWHPAPKIYKEDCRINWNDPSEKILNFVRGLSPYPAAWTEISNGRNAYSLKIYKASLRENKEKNESKRLNSDGKSFLDISAADGTVSIHELQLAGKKRMGIGDFLRGFKEIADYDILD